MSDMEKAQQIGELIMKREEQRKALAHLTLKGEKISASYSAFAFSRERWRLDPMNGKIYIQQPRDNEGQAPEYLLSRDELAQYVREFQDAKQQLAETDQQLQNLGIPK
ncbi:MAG TPA: hypothetical protein VF126_17525 [Acidobacteriaceae bacterium]